MRKRSTFTLIVAEGQKDGEVVSTEKIRNFEMC